MWVCTSSSSVGQVGVAAVPRGANVHLATWTRSRSNSLVSRVPVNVRHECNACTQRQRSQLAKTALESDPAQCVLDSRVRSSDALVLVLVAPVVLMLGSKRWAHVRVLLASDKARRRTVSVCLGVTSAPAAN